MLDDLRRIIESEMEYDDLNDIMMEGTDSAIANMFIEEDGEAVISDSEVLGILEKIPEYDEEAAMNKKLARIAEAYIPEELEYEEVEEGFKDALVKLIRSFSKKGRERNKGVKYLENVRRAFDEQFKTADANLLKEMKKGLIDAINTNKPLLEKEEDEFIKQLMEKQTKWMEDSIQRIDDKLKTLQESTQTEENDLGYLYEMFGLEDLDK